MSGTLYLIPCPISSSAPEETIPQRTLEVARSLDYFLVEAARTARGTLKSMGHPQPISTLTIEEIGHDPEAGKIDAWLAPVVEGRSAGIISESGCPGIADPGAQIVQRAHELGIRVVPLTGPSSLLLTLMASGLDGQRFRFLGYLPIHEDERRSAILAAEAASRASETQLCIETPYRNTAFLAGLIETLSPTTRLTVALDITGENESIRTKTVADWKKATEEERTLPKIPCVFAFLAELGERQAPRYAPKNAARKSMGHNLSRGKPQGEKPFRKKRPSSNRS